MPTDSVPMLEDPNACALCGKTVGGGGGSFIPVYLCTHCYSQWQTEYLAKTAWLAYLANREKQRRKRRNRVLKAGRLPVFVELVDEVTQ